MSGVSNVKVGQLVDLILGSQPDQNDMVRYGVVTAITSNTITVKIGNAPTGVPGLHHLSTYVPVVNDVVVLLKSGASYVVLGKLA